MFRLAFFAVVAVASVGCLDPYPVSVTGRIETIDGSADDFDFTITAQDGQPAVTTVWTTPPFGFRLDAPPGDDALSVTALGCGIVDVGNTPVGSTTFYSGTLDADRDVGTVYVRVRSCD